MADDYVLYRENTEEAFTFKDMDDLRQYAIDKLGMSNRNNKPDDFAIKVYMAEMGTPFEYGGEKFIVWDDEFSGYHQYHASTKKSTSKPQSFSDMVAKQRSKNNGLRKISEDEAFEATQKMGLINYLLNGVEQVIREDALCGEVNDLLYGQGCNSMQELGSILTKYRDSLHGIWDEYVESRGMK